MLLSISTYLKQKQNNITARPKEWPVQFRDLSSNSGFHAAILFTKDIFTHDNDRGHTRMKWSKKAWSWEIYFGIPRINKIMRDS